MQLLFFPAFRFSTMNCQRSQKPPLVKGHSWYLVDTRWFEKPGPIDNSALLKIDGSDIRDDLIEGVDFVLVHNSLWNFFVKSYGKVEGQEPIRRKVVEDGMFVKKLMVEVYLKEFQVAENSHLQDVRAKRFSRSDTLGTVLNVMRTEFNISEDAECNLWKRNSNHTERFEEITSLDVTLLDSGFYNNVDIFMIEVKNDDGTWPLRVGYQQKRNRRRSSSSIDFDAFKKPLEQVEKLKERLSVQKKDLETNQEATRKVISEKEEEKWKNVATISGARAFQRINKDKRMKLEIEIEKLRDQQNSLLTKDEHLEVQIKSVQMDQRRLEKQILNVKQKSAVKENEIKIEISQLNESLSDFAQVAKEFLSSIEPDEQRTSNNPELFLFLSNSIRKKEVELACPVCLETADVPIFMCSQMHLICSKCRPRIQTCPECREVYQGPPKRHRYAERIAQELRELRKEFSTVTSSSSSTIMDLGQ